MAGVSPCMAIFQSIGSVMITLPTGVQRYWVLGRKVSMPIQRLSIWTCGDRLILAKAGGFILRRQARQNSERSPVRRSLLTSCCSFIFRLHYKKPCLDKGEIVGNGQIGRV